MFATYLWLARPGGFHETQIFSLFR